MLALYNDTISLVIEQKSKFNYTLVFCDLKCNLIIVYMVPDLSVGQEEELLRRVLGEVGQQFYIVVNFLILFNQIIKSIEWRFKPRDVSDVFFERFHAIQLLISDIRYKFSQ